MIDITRIMKQDRLCRALTGMRAFEIEILLGKFSSALRKIRQANNKNPQRKYGGGRKGHLRNDLEKLIVVLIYLKTYPTYDLMSIMFGADRGQCCRWIGQMFEALEQALGYELVLPVRQINSFEEFVSRFPDVKDVFIDGTERKINRPNNKKSANKHYSGKKKQIARKTIIVSDEKRRILCVSKTKSARRHDKRLTDKFNIIKYIPSNVTIWADTGFVGLNHPNTQIPRKASKKNPLIFKDKLNNKLISGIRVVVEHAICGLKRMKGARDKYRNHLINFDDKMTLLSAGLWNFHLKYQM